MSDTPQTDEAAFVAGPPNDRHDVVTVQFAEQLERELNAAKAENAAMREAINGVYKILQSIQCNDIFEDTMRNYAVIALSKLQPFLKP